MRLLSLFSHLNHRATYPLACALAAPAVGPALLAALAASVVSSPAQAQGDLLVAPTRVVFPGGGSAEVVLSNIGAQPATYRISLELRRMNEKGELHVIEEKDYTPEQQAMLAMFRYSPRKILLPPGQPQSVRISARPAEGVADGEYRVHMLFRAVPEATPTTPTAAPQQTPENTPPGGFSIKLTPIYGVSIPIILRKGQLDATATLSSPQVVRRGTNTVFNLTIARTGDRSTYGEIRVLAPGAKEPSYVVRGISTYPEITHRTLEVALSPDQAGLFKGPMTVEYREMPEAGGKLIASVLARF